MANEDQQKLLLTIDANVELLRRNLNQAERDVGQFERRVNQSAGQVETGFGKLQRTGVAALASLSGAIASIGAVGFAQLGRQVLQFADDLEAAADQANISVERYQTLREGLRSLELTTEQTDRVLKSLSATLGEVQGGTAAEGVINALDKMGITARILNGEIDTSDELLDAIAASSTGFATEAEFTASVVDLLGKKVGVDLAAALRDGGAALKASETNFRSAGNVIDREMVQRLADANESIGRFTSTLEARTAITVANILRDIAAVGRALSNIGEGGFIGVGRGLLAENARIASRDLEIRTEASLEANGANSLSAFSRLGPPRVVQGEDIVVVAPRRTAGGRSGGAGPARSARPGASAADRIADARADAFQGVASRLTTDAQNPLSAITTDLESIQGAAEQLGKNLADSFGVGVELTRDISRNIAQGIIFGENVGKALTNGLKAAGAEAAANGLFALFRSLGGGSNLGSALKAGLSAALGGVRALGGPVSAGVPYLVGEKEPELFVPSVPGRILNGAQIGAMGGTQNVNVTVEPSELFVTTVAVTAQRAGAEAAGGVVRRATRGRLMGSMGA